MIHYHHYHSSHSNLSEDEDSPTTSLNEENASSLNILASSYDDSTLQQQFYSSMVVEWQLKYIDFKFVNDRLKNIQEELKQLKRSSSTNQITSHDRTHRRRRSIGASLYRFAVDRVLATSSSSNTSENDNTTSQGHHPFDHDIQELIHDFKYLLYKELNKINSFYTQQENAMIIEHDRLLEQIEKINEMFHDRQYASSLLSNTSSNNNNKLQILTFNQRQKLKEGLEEHYYNLNLLLNYRLVNFNALIYLCTRLEEIVGRKVKWSFYEMNEMIHPSTNDHETTTIRNDHETTTITTTTHSTIGMTSQINSQFNQSCMNEEDDFKLSTNKFIKSQYFKDSKIVEHHIRDTVEYYAEYFFEKDTKAAIAALGKMRGGILGSASGGYGGSYGSGGGTFFHSSSKDVFYSGILLGTLFILIGVNIFYYFHTYEFAPNLSSIDYSDQSFSLYRLILFPVMLAFLIAVNIRIWSSHSINYIFILGLNPLMSLQTFRFLTITLLMLNIIFVSQLMYMMNTVSYLYGIMNIGKYAYWHPIILWILLLLYLFNPFKILNFEFRYWFLKCVLRMLASPFTAVRFSDFFIADQLTSLGDVLFELQFIACIYPATSQSNVMKLFCDSTKSIGIPILNYIPYHCRFMQCLRKYYDTRQKMHLLNALKYASNCIVVIVAFIDKLMMMTRGTHDSYWTFLRIVWLIGNMCSTCLKLYWDLKIDMGLFENGVSLLSWPWSSSSSSLSSSSTSSSSSSFHLFLRRKLIFSPLYYYLAMIGNIILRWVWLPFVFVKAFVFIEPSTLEWILYMFITLELLRRFVWNIFRVEHENLANIENYRATKDIPLPFDTTTTSNRIEQVQSKKNFYMDLKKTSHDKASSWARKVMEMAKSMLLCFGRGDAVDDEDIWIIDEEELERLRRENAKRPNLKIQLTLPFDLETLRREFGVVPHSREQTTSDHLVTSSNQIHTDSNQSSVGVVGVAGSGASAANTTEEPLRVGKDHRPYSLTENSNDHTIVMMDDDHRYDLENDKLL